MTQTVDLVDIYLVPDRVELLYRLLGERDSISNISHSKMPTLAEHSNFVESRPYATWCFILADGKYVGAIYLTHNNEIGLQIFKKHRRMGYGLAAIKAMTSTIEPLPGIPSVRAKEFCVNVSPYNDAGKHLMNKAGFRLRQFTYNLPKVDKPTGKITKRKFLKLIEPELDKICDLFVPEEEAIKARDKMIAAFKELQGNKK